MFGDGIQRLLKKHQLANANRATYSPFAPHFEKVTYPNGRGHILFVSVGLRGHATPLIHMATEMVRRGYRVTFATHTPGREWVRRARKESGCTSFAKGVRNHRGQQQRVPGKSEGLSGQRHSSNTSTSFEDRTTNANDDDSSNKTKADTQQEHGVVHGIIEEDTNEDGNGVNGARDGDRSCSGGARGGLRCGAFRFLTLVTNTGALLFVA
jgi:hypothetical protein